MSAMRQHMTKIERHDHILRTAKNLFQQYGYDHVTIADVIKASNIARGTFYLHFDSLEMLLTDLFEEVVNQTWARIAPFLEEIEDVEACTIEIVHAVFRMFDDDDESMIGVFFSGGGAEFMRKREEALYDKLGGLVVTALDRRHQKLYGHADAGVSLPKTEWTVAMLVSVVANMSHYFATRVSPEDKQAFEQSLVQFVVAGLLEHLTPLMHTDAQSQSC